MKVALKSGTSCEARVHLLLGQHASKREQQIDSQTTVQQDLKSPVFVGNDCLSPFIRRGSDFVCLNLDNLRRHSIDNCFHVDGILKTVFILCVLD